MFNRSLWMVLIIKGFNWYKIVFLGITWVNKVGDLSFILRRSLISATNKLYSFFLVILFNQICIMLCDQVLDKEAFQKQMLEKLIWISAFMLVGARHPGATVGVVEKEYCSEVEPSCQLYIFVAA